MTPDERLAREAQDAKARMWEVGHENDALRERLAKLARYTVHWQNCAIRMGVGCTCGLAALLAEGK